MSAKETAKKLTKVFVKKEEDSVETESNESSGPGSPQEETPYWHGNGPPSVSPQVRKLNCRNLEMLKQMGATGMQVWSAAVDLFGHKMLNSLTLKQAQHLIYNVDRETMALAVNRRRGALYLSYIKESEVYLRHSFAWNFDKMLTSWIGRCQRSTKPKVLLRNMWMLWAVPIYHNELSAREQSKSQPAFRPISITGWKNYFILLVEYIGHENFAVSYAAIEIFYNALLLSDVTVTRQFLSQQPCPRTNLLPHHLFTLASKVAWFLTEDQKNKFTTQFFKYRSLGFIYLTMYPKVATPPEPHAHLAALAVIKNQPPRSSSASQDLKLPGISDITGQKACKPKPGKVTKPSKSK